MPNPALLKGSDWVYTLYFMPMSKNNVKAAFYSQGDWNSHSLFAFPYWWVDPIIRWMRWKHFAPKSALVHPIGGVSDGSEERWCLDFSKTLMLPSYAYLFLFFSCRKPAKASGAEYFEKVILVYVSASIENPAIGLQAHLCLSQLQTNSRSGCRKDWTTQLLQLLYKQARCGCHL